MARGANVIGIDRDPTCKPLEGDPDVDRLPEAFHRGRADEAGEGGVGGDGSGGTVTGRILRTELGPHSDAAFADADVVVLSPGVPLTQPQVAAVLAASRRGGGGEYREGVTVVSELAFASQCLPRTLPVVAVTGTNGKSTVCTFVGQLLRSCGAEVFVGGNLGTPLADCALDFVSARCVTRLETTTDDDNPGTWPYDAVVVECSSYQLEHPGDLRFDVACVINLTPDHMERHGSMEAYANAKARVFAALKGAGKVAVLPAGTGSGVPAAPSSSTVEGGPDGGREGEGRATLLVGTEEEPEALDWKVVGARMLERGRVAAIKEATGRAEDRDSRAAGGGVAGGSLARIGSLPGVVVNLDARTATIQLPEGRSEASADSAASAPAAERSVVDLSPLTAVGAHNANNAAVALLLAHALDPALFPVRRLARGLADLTPPPHRMQLVACTGDPEHGGIQWVDDSKATNVEAAAAGLGGYDRRAVVLLGGMAKEGVGPGGKGLGFAALVPVLRRHQGVVCFGGSGAAIASELRAVGLEPMAEVASMFEAVEAAREAVLSGGAVVLSPGCASFDEFDNFVHRGLVFADLANGRPPTPSAKETP